ncbi:LINE-1 type transposase domain-containing protein 1 [Seriola dumerili]|nr:LINE-1 type transposase domain-containing protein 1 [Seriola dumerili]
MSKSHGTRQGKGQPQLTQHFSPHDKDASKADASKAGASKAGASNVATGGAQPLTLDMLIGELEKLRKDVTGELTTSLNTAMAPIQASLQKIADTVASHTATISAMETALSSHSDDLSTLQHEVATLKSKVETTTQMNEKLQLAVEDLVSRSKRQNLRVIGIPEGAEGTDTRLFMTTLFKDVIGDTPPDTSFELDRAHRSLGPKPAQGSRPILVRFHRYIQKERVLLWAKKTRGISYQGYPIRFFEDFSASLAKKRASFNKVKSLLYKDGIRFGLIYPARLRVTIDGQSRMFDSADEAERFYRDLSSK